MWTVAVYLIDRIDGAARTWGYGVFNPAETKAIHIREHGFAVRDAYGDWLHYGAHRVDYVSIHKEQAE